MNNSPLKSVLLADGFAPALVLAEEILTRTGYSVTAVSTYEEALGMLESKQYDVLVTSSKLQSVNDGYALLKLAAARFPDLKLVLHSGSPQPESVKVHGFALKVHGDKDLVGIVEKVLSA